MQAVFHPAVEEAADGKGSAGDAMVPQKRTATAAGLPPNQQVRDAPIQLDQVK